MSSASNMTPERIAVLVGAIRANKIVDYAAVVSITIVYFDYLYTFPREVNLMWKTRLSVPKVLYFTLRYYIMIHSMMWMTYHADETLSGSRCKYPFSRNSVSSQVVLTLCEAISYIRAYAFSGGNIYLLIFIIAHFIAVTVVGFYYIVVFIRSADFLDLPPDLRLGCFPKAGDGFALAMIVITLLVSLLSATLVMVFFGLKRHRSLRGTKNSLIRVFYQDGIFYFICLSALQAADITIFFLAPANGMQLLLVQPQVHFSALLATRMLLHLREWSEGQQIIMGTGEMSFSGTAWNSGVGPSKFQAAQQFHMSELTYTSK